MSEDSNYDSEDDDERKYKKNNLSKLISLDPEDDCLEDGEKEKNDNDEYDDEDYRYHIDIILIDGMAYRRIADAIGVFDAFPRTKPDTFEIFGENNYGRYKCDEFIIDISHNQLEVKFRELDEPYIQSIMNKITDSLLYPRDDYYLYDDLDGL
jgi:hypothetical protein